jgi:hypothetical protein
MQALASAQSKFGLSDLALRSIVELERMNAGMDFEKGALEDLSVALLHTSHPDQQSEQVGFIDPTYYDPFERLYRASAVTADVNVEKIQEYLRQISEQLSVLADGGAASPTRLLTVCINLHKELVQELLADDDTAAQEWPEHEGATAGLSPA